MVDAGVAARILVAEDDVIVGQDIEESLRGLGYEVAGLVRTGEEAVQAARELAPDLVLMDIRMPGLIDGVEAADRILEHMEVPVVYLTAYSDDSTVTRAKETGPFGYLVKPFDDRELKTSIELAIYRHHTDRLVRESRERYRRLFEDDIAAHYVSTPAGKVLAANQAFAELLGLDEVDEVLDLDARSIYPSESEREEFLERIRKEGKVRSRRSLLVTPDRRTVPILENARGVFDERGRLKEIHGNLVDMTRERMLEEHLRRTARMEAAGRLAGGVAHRFNNILTGIRGRVELVLADEELSEESREDLRSVLESCEQAAETIQGLFATGGGMSPQERRPVDLADLLRDMYDVLSGLLGEERELFLSVGGGSAVVDGDASQLERVLLDLVLNARAALPEGGRVRLRLEGAATAEVVSAAVDEDQPHDWVRLTVSDSGEGMDEAARERIFEPFDTAERIDGGPGLATVYGIVQEHGGDIVVDSEPGGGSTFHVYLPRGQAEEQE